MAIQRRQRNSCLLLLSHLKHAGQVLFQPDEESNLWCDNDLLPPPRWHTNTDTQGQTEREEWTKAKPKRWGEENPRDAHHIASAYRLEDQPPPKSHTVSDKGEKSQQSETSGWRWRLIKVILAAQPHAKNKSCSSYAVYFAVVFNTPEHSLLIVHFRPLGSDLQDTQRTRQTLQATNGSLISLTAPSPLFTGCEDGLRLHS